MELSEKELVYTTDIDYDYLSTLDYAGVIDYAERHFSLGGASKEFRNMATTMLAACKSVGLTPDNEQFLFIITDMNRVLCESCAGSGKTTMSQMSILKYKLVDRVPADKILCIAYNNNAVKDMQKRHRQIVDTLNMTLRAAYDKRLAAGTTVKEWSKVMISPDLKCKTIHSLAKEWIVTYKDRFRINPDNFLITEDQQEFYLELCARETIKRNTIKFVPPSMFKEKAPTERELAEFSANYVLTPKTVSDLVRVYGFAKETLTMNNPDMWAPVMPSETGPGALTRHQMRLIFGYYELYKQNVFKMDFNDLLNKFYELVCDPEVNKRLRQNYSILLVDEYQDVTPAMLRIIKVFAEGRQDPDPQKSIARYHDLKMICVGDTDQSIYGYRGTDPKNCIRFKADYMRPDIQDARILSMSVNRRCGTKILEDARKVIESSAQRIRKPIRGLREGGNCKLIRFKSQEDQIDKIFGIIRNIPKNEWGDTVICYRNNTSAQHIGLKLFREKIPFKNLKSSEQMFSDKMSTFAENVLDMFVTPYHKEAMWYVLYRVLPTFPGFHKADLQQIIERKANDTRFWEIDFSKYTSKSKELEAALNTVYNCYKLYKKGSTFAGFMPEMFDLFYKKKNIFLRGTSEETWSYYSAIREYYSRDVSYHERSNEVNKMNEHIRDSDRQGTCLALSTFHGLKGLEFKNVIIIDMYQNQIPGADYVKQCQYLNDPTNMLSNSHATDLIRQQAYATLEESKRLFYVAITRAKDKCWILEPSHGASQLLEVLSENVNKSHYFGEADSKLSNIVSNSKDIFKESDIDPRSLTIGQKRNVEINVSFIETSVSKLDGAQTNEFNGLVEDSEVNGLDLDVGLGDLDVKDLEIEDVELDSSGLDNAGIDGIDTKFNGIDMSVETPKVKAAGVPLDEIPFDLEEPAKEVPKDKQLDRDFVDLTDLIGFTDDMVLDGSYKRQVDQEETRFARDDSTDKTEMSGISKDSSISSTSRFSKVSGKTAFLSQFKKG